MGKENQSLCLQDLLLSLSHIVDLINPAVNEHHRYVAYIAFRLAKTMGYNKKELQDIVLAAALHDIGAFSEKERLELLNFEKVPGVDHHAESGYQLLYDFEPLATAAKFIRFHHAYWHPAKHEIHKETSIPIESYLIHLADRVAVLINKDKSVLSQISDIRKRIADNSNDMFMPELVDVFQDVAATEEFWLDILYEPIDDILRKSLELEPISLDEQQFEKLTNMFRRLIDFRSAFTSTHSSGVAATASMIASEIGFPDDDVRTMRLAGHLHDLGKLAIPSEILEKNDVLTSCESSVMRTHTYHTNRMLLPLPALDTIRTWAALHHERLDGMGYPFHVSGTELPLGSRIMAAADVFTALTEDRPYRTGMPSPDALEIIDRMVGNRALDPDVIEYVYKYTDDINQSRIDAQEKAQQEYQVFVEATT